MRRTFLLLGSALFVAVLVMVAARPARAAKDWIDVTVKYIGSSDQTFEMKDGVSGISFEKTLSPYKEITFPIKSNKALDDGYGDLWYRVKGASEWNHHQKIKDKEKILL